MRGETIADLASEDGAHALFGRNASVKSVFISVHDFRSLRKASVHFIASEMARRGDVRFLSVGLSRLSLHRGDTRSSLVARANRVERHNGVDCYLWKTAWHPFNIRKTSAKFLEAPMFRLYRGLLPAVARRWIKEADVAFVESGMSVVFLADIKRINPRAKIIYLASDDLEVIDSADTIRSDFRRHFDEIDLVRLPSRYLLAGMPHGKSAALIPHGVDRTIAEKRYPDPYAGQKACVSLGSMLFDAEFFRIAAPAFPDVTFHIIGAGKAAADLQGDNIVIHPEMAFEQTLGYLQHAAFGVAPYRDEKTPRYLIDTSLKLRQFGLFGIPAVCPTFALGDAAGRFGYTPGNAASIRTAITAAMTNQDLIVDSSNTWSEVVDRLLHPEAFPDTRL
ncbi:MAG TPA: polysaccharide biosynthesis protein GumK [Acidisoma sp.]|uniref:GumK N-terminal domain-containing glycosyltransferase n=1 Tax=Acidisoma sp. TaxID=1872115 RepID=UPI002C189188|nr:polysaccharide biosynthesis protein GumK [Acidisoma sp.]HTI02378.1 polysaccharide biosynthesis protein GumK [Acidisoma sp.]